MSADSYSREQGDTYSDARAKYGELQLPQLSSEDLANIYSRTPKQTKEPDYLDYNVKKRSLWESVPYTTGLAYLGGIGVGGLHGFLQGYRQSGNQRWKLRLNKIMNSAGSRGSMYGNFLGVAAAYYLVAESFWDWVGLDQFGIVRRAGISKVLNPVLSGASAGLLYGSMKSQYRRGISVGVAAVGAVYAVDQVLPHVIPGFYILDK